MHACAQAHGQLACARALTRTHAILMFMRGCIFSISRVRAMHSRVYFALCASHSHSYVKLAVICTVYVVATNACTCYCVHYHINLISCFSDQLTEISKMPPSCDHHTFCMLDLDSRPLPSQCSGLSVRLNSSPSNWCQQNKELPLSVTEGLPQFSKTQYPGSWCVLVQSW